MEKGSEGISFASGNQSTEGFAFPTGRMPTADERKNNEDFAVPFG